MTLEERFDKFDDDSHKFERVKKKRSNRADLHAFLLLDEILLGTGDIVSGAEHDEIYLNVDMDEFEKVVTDEQIQELRRCGVFIGEYNCLTMFV